MVQRICGGLTVFAIATGCGGNFTLNDGGPEDDSMDGALADAAAAMDGGALEGDGSLPLDGAVGDEDASSEPGDASADGGSSVPAPIWTGTSPMSPSTGTSVTLQGASAGGATIRLYTDVECTGSMVATTTAETGGDFSFDRIVATNSTTLFYATATLGGSTSACTASPAIFISSEVDYSLGTSWVARDPAPSAAVPALNSMIVQYVGTNGCQGADQTIPYRAATDSGDPNYSPYDIFYFYPTGTTPMGTGNVSLSDLQSTYLAELKDYVVEQVGSFVQFGRVFAPMYRKATSSTFSQSGSTQATPLILAANDAMAAFHYYLNHDNAGRKVILVGHSQGALMASMLLRRLADTNPSIRARIFLTVVGGLGGSALRPYTAEGSLTGGFWENIPICQAATDIDCVMSWMTWKVGGAALADPSATAPIMNANLTTAGFLFQTYQSSAHRVLYDPLGFPSSAPGAPNVAYSLYRASDLKYFQTSCGLAGGHYDAIDTDGSGDPDTILVALNSRYRAHNSDSDPSDGKYAVMITLEGTTGDPLPVEEQSSPCGVGSMMFNSLGYHRYDYSVVIGDVINRIWTKLCADGFCPAHDLTLGC